jgi:hypothetical protein
MCLGDDGLAHEHRGAFDGVADDAGARRRARRRCERLKRSVRVDTAVSELCTEIGRGRDSVFALCRFTTHQILGQGS